MIYARQLSRDKKRIAWPSRDREAQEKEEPVGCCFARLPPFGSHCFFVDHGLIALRKDQFPGLHLRPRLIDVSFAQFDRFKGRDPKRWLDCL